jgi:hypothetical protein
VTKFPRPISWYGLVAAGGFAFGLLGQRRPFGSDVLAHPFVVFFVAVGVVLLVLRAVYARPVPELIPERALVIGCVLGAAMFLAANWLVAHLL